MQLIWHAFIVQNTKIFVICGKQIVIEVGVQDFKLPLLALMSNVGHTSNSSCRSQCAGYNYLFAVRRFGVNFFGALFVNTIRNPLADISVWFFVFWHED